MTQRKHRPPLPFRCCGSRERQTGIPSRFMPLEFQSKTRVMSMGEELGWTSAVRMTLVFFRDALGKGGHELSRTHDHEHDQHEYEKHRAESAVSRNGVGPIDLAVQPQERGSEKR